MICEELGLSHPLLLRYEAQAEASYRPELFSHDTLLRLAEQAALVPDDYAQIAAFVPLIDERMKRFMWLYWTIQFCSDEDFSCHLWDRLEPIPMPAAMEEAYPGMLKTVFYLAAAQHLREWVDENGLEKSYYEDYFDRFRYFLELNRIQYHTCGLVKLAAFLYCYRNRSLFGSDALPIRFCAILIMMKPMRTRRERCSLSRCPAARTTRMACRMRRLSSGRATALTGRS